MIIEQLVHTREGVKTVEDADMSLLSFDKAVTVRDDQGRSHQYRLYVHEKDAKPVGSEDVHYKNRVKDNTPPFRIYTVKNGEKVVDLVQLTHEFHQRWGDGCFRGFFCGGKQNGGRIKYFWKRRWIEKVV